MRQIKGKNRKYPKEAVRLSHKWLLFSGNLRGRIIIFLPNSPLASDRPSNISSLILNNFLWKLQNTNACVRSCALKPLLQLMMLSSLELPYAITASGRDKREYCTRRSPMSSGTWLLMRFNIWCSSEATNRPSSFDCGWCAGLHKWPVAMIS